jgi:hypothetical protein
MFGAGGEVVLGVPGAFDGVGDQAAEIGVEDAEADGDDKDGVVSTRASQLGREFVGEGGEVGALAPAKPFSEMSDEELERYAATGSSTL